MYLNEYKQTYIKYMHLNALHTCTYTPIHKDTILCLLS